MENSDINWILLQGMMNSGHKGSKNSVHKGVNFHPTSIRVFRGPGPGELGCFFFRRVARQDGEVSPWPRRETHVRAGPIVCRLLQSCRTLQVSRWRSAQRWRWKDDSEPNIMYRTYITSTNSILKVARSLPRGVQQSAVLCTLSE